jgi:hypothetical protein
MVVGMGISGAGVDTDALSTLIADVKASGGSEIANTQPFVERLCRALGLPVPAFSNQQNHQNDYVFERRIAFKHPDGTTTPGRIDLSSAAASCWSRSSRACARPRRIATS